MANQQSRSDQRSKLPVDARTQMLEYDVDALERLVRESIATQHRIQQILVGVLISVATGSVLLAINLVIAAAKP